MAASDTKQGKCLYLRGIHKTSLLFWKPRSTVCVCPGTDSNLVILERASPAGGKLGVWGIISSLYFWSMKWESGSSEHRSRGGGQEPAHRGGLCIS